MSFFSTANLKTALKNLALISCVLCICCSSVFAHEWTIEGVKVKAKAVDFIGTKVLLEDEGGNQKSVPMNELNATDLQYLTNLLSIRNAAIQQNLEQQQLQQQQAQLTSQFVDVWNVRMVAMNGQSGWRNYFAINSLQAKQLALQDFPNARIQSVQKLPRRGSVGLVGNANNIGLFNRRASFVPVVTILNTRNF